MAARHSAAGERWRVVFARSTQRWTRNGIATTAAATMSYPLITARTVPARKTDMTTEKQELLLTRALRMADMSLAAWENGHAFDSHGPSREAQRLVAEALDALATAQPAEPVAWVNGSELDNMLDDRTATIEGHKSGWRGVPLYDTAQRAYPLPDSLYPDSKDWQAADYAGRVEWLHMMYENTGRFFELQSAPTELVRISADKSKVTLNIPALLAWAGITPKEPK